MPNAMTTRSGDAFPIRCSLACCNPLPEVQPPTAWFMNTTLLPKRRSSARAVKSPYAGQPGGDLITSEALPPAEILSPQSISFTGRLLRSFAIVLGSDSPAYIGVGPFHWLGSKRYATSTCNL